MSVDIHFQPCRFDGTTEKRLNPFIKEIQEFPRDQPLSESEAQAVVKALKQAGAQPDGEDYFVSFPDGGSAEIVAGDLKMGCMFAIRSPGITPAMGQLLFDVMIAGSWVITGPGGGTEIVIGSTKDCVKNAPPTFPRVVVARSGQEVADLLSGRLEAGGQPRRGLGER